MTTCRSSDRRGVVVESSQSLRLTGDSLQQATPPPSSPSPPPHSLPSSPNSQLSPLLPLFPPARGSHRAAISKEVETCLLKKHRLLLPPLPLFASPHSSPNPHLPLSLSSLPHPLPHTLPAPRKEKGRRSPPAVLTTPCPGDQDTHAPAAATRESIYTSVYFQYTIAYHFSICILYIPSILHLL